MKILPTEKPLALLLLGLCCVAMPLSGFSQNARVIRDSSVQIPPSAERPDGVIEVDAVFDNLPVTYLKDVVYARYGDRELVVNLLLPAENSSPRPLVMFVPGSAWLPQNLYQGIPRLVDVARAGYVVASVEYRHSLEAIAPAQVQDVKAAIRFMRANQDEYNIDPSKVAIWGTSSGGHLSALTGTSAGEEAFMTADNSLVSDAVQAVIDFYGPTDFRRMDEFPSQMTHNAPDSPESRVVGGPIQDPRFRDAVAAYNPITYISPDEKLPPFLIVHGDVDALVPFNQSVLLYEALQKVEADVTFYKVKGAGHGDGIFSKPMMKTVIGFLDEYLK